MSNIGKIPKTRFSTPGKYPTHFHQIPSKRYGHPYLHQVTCSPLRGSDFDLHTKARDAVVVVAAVVAVVSEVVVDVLVVVVSEVVVDVLVVVVADFAGAALVDDAAVLVGSGSGKDTAGGLVMV